MTTLETLDQEISTVERVVLVGLHRDAETQEATELSLQELERLVESCGGLVVDRRVVRLRDPHPATLISKGHMDALVGWVEVNRADILCIDDDFSPVQQRNMEKAFGCRVLTRTEIILDIFATHARSRESMTQVELAQLKYRASRLVGAPIATAKMGGASARIATRGPGETQLEVDRRHIRERVQRLERSLKVIRQHRAIQRQRRMRSGIPMVGIVGYTNAGKSTLLNRLTQAGVLAENRLFSTLDTTVRTLSLPGGFEVGLIDTVGFVNKLPHELVAAFRATLEEIMFADIILHVADASSPRLEVECMATDDILKSLKCENTPRLTVWNKTDLIDDPFKRRMLPHNRPPAVAISALKGEGIPELLRGIEKLVLEHGRIATLLIPYDKYELVARLHRESQVLDSRDLAEGKLLLCRLAPHVIEAVAPFHHQADWDKLDAEIPGAEAPGVPAACQP